MLQRLRLILLFLIALTVLLLFFWNTPPPPPPRDPDDRESMNWTTVHQTWKNQILSAEKQKWRATWIKLGLEVTLSDDAMCLEDVKRLSEELSDDRYLKVYQHLETKVQQSDFWRYTKLYLDGGFYVDIDVIAKPQILGFFQKHAEAELLVFKESEADPLTRLKFWWGVPCSTFVRCPQYHNNIIGARPKHPALKSCLDRIVQNFLTGNYKQYQELRRTLELTGPGVWTDAIQEYLGQATTIDTGSWYSILLFSHEGMGTWKEGDVFEVCWVEVGWFAFLITGVVAAVLFVVYYCGWISYIIPRTHRHASHAV